MDLKDSHLAFLVESEKDVAEVRAFACELPIELILGDKVAKDELQLYLVTRTYAPTCEDYDYAVFIECVGGFPAVPFYQLLKPTMFGVDVSCVSADRASVEYKDSADIKRSALMG